MKVVQAEALNSVADYRFIEGDEPKPGPNDVIIKVASCGMGYVDALVALGRYQVKPPLPFTPGQEISGTIAAFGGKATDFALGERVMATVFGGLAEYVRAAKDFVKPIPEAMSFNQAAAFRINYVTALHGLRDRGRLQPKDRLLVFGAAGGVGTAAVQLGALMGAEVIACASTDEKRSFAKSHGAHQLIDTAAEGWRDRLKTICGGKGPDVIFDPVCGPLFEPAFRSLTWGGRHLVVGFTGGPIPALPINLSLMKGASLVGVDVRQFGIFEAERASAHLAELLQWVADGRLAPIVGRRFAFEDFAEAMQFAMSGQALGKPVIEVGEKST